MTDYSEEIPTAAGYYVYRFWAGDGTSLYVGRVGDSGPRPPERRFSQHRSSKSWWPDVARIDIAELHDHAAMVAEEVEQIRALQPLRNRQHNACSHDLSLPGAVRPSDGHCSMCYRERSRKYSRSPAWAAYNATPARKVQKREADLKRPSGGARTAIRKRRPSNGQAPLW